MANKKKRAKAASRTARPLLLCLGLLAAAALFGLLEPYWWFGGLMRELGFQLALLASIAAGFALSMRAWWVAAAASGLVLLFAWPLFAFYRPLRLTPQAGPVLRVASAHLAGADLRDSELASFLARERPDALALTGLRQSARFGARFGSYRVTRGSGHLRALLLVQSALALPVQEPPDVPPSQPVRAGRCHARIAAIELPERWAFTALDARKRSIAALTRLPTAPRSIWLGQLGSRADAHDLRAFLAKQGLRDGRLGHGRLATGPSWLAGLGFARAHLLVHGWISVREATLEAPISPGAERTLSAILELTEPRCRPL